MDIERILKAGYFDNLKINGSLSPIINYYGTDISDGNSFKIDLNTSSESFKHGIAKLEISIYGISDINMSFTELERIRQDREKAGIKQFLSTDKFSSDIGIVGYVNILILKSGYALPYMLKSNGKNISDIEKLATTAEMLNTLVYARSLSDYIAKRYDYSDDLINIAIIDRVYVSRIFRRCGVSTWIHRNITDIINMYSMVFPLGVIQTYGDFSNECETAFNMSKDSYDKMLYKHYKSLGYSKITNLNMKSTYDGSKILYKLFI